MKYWIVRLAHDRRCGGEYITYIIYTATMQDAEKIALERANTFFKKDTSWHIECNTEELIFEDGVALYDYEEWDR